MKLIFIRIASSIMIIYFFLVSLLQFNDPNPFIGLSLYICSIGITLLVIFKRAHLLFMLLTSMFLIILSGFWWFKFFLDRNECLPLEFDMCPSGQSAFGFSISSIWVLFLTLYSYRFVQETTRYEKYLLISRIEDETKSLV